MIKLPTLLVSPIKVRFNFKLEAYVIVQLPKGSSDRWNAVLHYNKAVHTHNMNKWFWQPWEEYFNDGESYVA